MIQKMLLACLCLCLTAGTLLAQEDVAAARKTMQSYEKGIVTLSAVLKFEVKGASGITLPNAERKTYCIAAIIDPDGLAVTALKNLNPHARASAGRRQITLESQVQEVKYRLSDGTEVPARVVLKDEDLDLAFLAPLEPLDAKTKAKIAAVPLEAAPQPQALDGVILIGRTGEDLNFAPTLQLGRITATVSQPRPCYLCDVGISGALVFNAQGKLLGIFCQCVDNENSSDNTIAQLASKNLVLPTADMARLVPQAKEEISKGAAEKPKADSAEKKPDATEKKSDKTEKK